MAEVYLSIGSNLGDKEQNLTFACVNISNTIGVIEETSSMYESAAWGYKSENTFYNMVVKVHTDLSPILLLNECFKIEERAQRDRNLENTYQDRTLDIDILYYDNEIIHTKDLQIPHPHVDKRNFVLFPFFEINHNFTDPRNGKTIADLIKNSNDNSILTKLSRVKL